MKRAESNNPNDVVQSGNLARQIKVLDNFSESDFVQFLTVKLRLEKNSIRHTVGRARIFLGWVRNENLELSPPTAEKFLFYLKTERGLVNNSLNTYIFALRQLDLYLSDREMVFGLSSNLKSFPKTKKLISTLTLKEIDSLLSTTIGYKPYRGMDTSRLDDLYKTMIRFLASTGCRFDEMASLKISDLSLSSDKGTVMFKDTKNDEPRIMFITNPLVEEIKVQISGRDPNECVFVSMEGHKVAPQSFELDLKTRARMAEIEKNVHPHLFRYTYISRMCQEAKVPIEAVASLVGHKDIQTTYGIYYRAGSEYLRSQAFRDPMIRGHIAIKDVVEMFKEAVRSLGVDTDPRFKKTLFESGSKIVFELEW